jgi:hypothetical protein
VDYPCFSFEKLGPQRTIAKGLAERKAKSQKRLEKCGFYRGVWKSPLKQRLASHSNPGAVTLCAELARNFPFAKC